MSLHVSLQGNLAGDQHGWVSQSFRPAQICHFFLLVCKCVLLDATLSGFTAKNIALLSAAVFPRALKEMWLNTLGGFQRCDTLVLCGANGPWHRRFRLGPQFVHEKEFDSS